MNTFTVENLQNKLNILILMDGIINTIQELAESSEKDQDFEMVQDFEEFRKVELYFNYELFNIKYDSEFDEVLRIVLNNSNFEKTMTYFYKVELYNNSVSYEFYLNLEDKNFLESAIMDNIRKF